MIRIAAVLDVSVVNNGSFSQALNTVLQLQRLSYGRFHIDVYTDQRANLKFLTNIGLKPKLFRYSFVDYFFAEFAQSVLWNAIKYFLKLTCPFENTLIKHGCDVVYFTRPTNNSAMLQKLNYISSLWDLCHRDAPEFPEVRTFGIFSRREMNYRNNLSSAILVITDSEELSDSAATLYGIKRDRLLSMPFFPSMFIDEEFTNDDTTHIINNYGLVPGYFYYPAQFWAHKNHIRIIQALLILREEHSLALKVVFSGKDFGNLTHVKNFITAHGLDNQVSIIGFIQSEHLQGLYAGSLAVVMPTYFGPTNLPPLEAWKLDKPLIYSSHLSGQVGNAALLINPDDANELANAMLQCLDGEVRNRLVTASRMQLKYIAAKRSNSERDLCLALKRFSVRRECWR